MKEDNVENEERTGNIMKKDYERPEVEMKSLVSEEIMKGTGVEFDPEAPESPESQIMPIDLLDPNLSYDGGIPGDKDDL